MKMHGGSNGSEKGAKKTRDFSEGCGQSSAMLLESQLSAGRCGSLP
jgi:hypothetical protein